MSVLQKILMLGIALSVLSPQGLASAAVGSAVGIAESLAAGRNPRHDRRRGRRARGRRSAKKRGRAGKVTVPIDIGVGPVLMLPNPSIFVSQPAFTGMELSLAGIIDQALIHKYRHKIPRQYQSLARSVDEISYRPWYIGLIPERLILSPGIFPQGMGGTGPLDGMFSSGMYGAVWRLYGIGQTLLTLGQSKLSINLGLDFAYIYMHSSLLPAPTHFLRPGLNLELVLRVPVTRNFLLSAGWSSDVFVPQPLGQAPWVFWPLDQSLWHLGGPFIKLHFRVPYSVRL